MDQIRSGRDGGVRDPLRSQRRSATFADLLAAARDGRSWAVDDLADRYLPRLTSFAAARGAADPQGIADVVLLSVLGRLDQLDFQVPEQFWAYLCLSARSRVIDEHRAAKPVELVGDAQLFEEFGAGARPARPASDFDDVVVERDYVSGLLSPLTDEQRQVLELRFLDDLSVEETASRTGRSQGAIKGLQRRAINAIIAAVAVVLIVLALRGLGNDHPEGINSDPAGRDGSPPAQPDSGDAVSDPTGGIDGSGLIGGTEQGARLPVAGAGDPGQVDPTGPAVVTDQAVSDGSAAAEERFTITVGTTRGTRLEVSARPGSVSESNHGVRIPCVASHVSHSDPILFPGRPGAAPALVHWGNTAVDANSGSVDLTAVGNGTCEGGITDRSAYWMPALFDEDDQVVVPGSMLIEYKVFGGPGFDRSTIQPIPAGLQLVAGPTVDGGREVLSGPSGGSGSLTFKVLFPTCVAVDGGGRAVLSSPDHSSHLSYPSDRSGRSDGCPSTHPYRIPQLSFTTTYGVDIASGWYLASEDGSAQGHGTPTGGAISAWDSDGMAGVVSCLRDLRDGCWFGVDADGGGGRSQLPERFEGPDGRPAYDFGMSLAPGFDQTPFGTLVSPVSSA